MKAQIERIRSYVARIRRNPDASSSMNTLAMSEVADCLESIDERLSKLEALARPVTLHPSSEHLQRLQEILSRPCPPMPLLPGDDLADQAKREWAIGSKV